MKKKAIFVLVLALLMASMLCSVVFASEGITVKVNGQEVQFDTPPKMVDDRVLVPMRAIFEALGTMVSWDESTKTIIALDTEASISINLTVGEPSMLFVSDEQQTITLDVAPMIENERTYVPLRAISEALGCEVEWDKDTQTVTITSAPKKEVESYFHVDKNDDGSILIVANDSDWSVAVPDGMEGKASGINDASFSSEKNGAMETFHFQLVQYDTSADNLMNNRRGDFASMGFRASHDDVKITQEVAKEDIDGLEYYSLRYNYLYYPDWTRVYNILYITRVYDALYTFEVTSTEGPPDEMMKKIIESFNPKQ